MALNKTNKANIAIPKKNKANTGMLTPMAPGNTMKIIGDDSKTKATTKRPNTMEIIPKNKAIPTLNSTGPIKIATKMKRIILSGDFLWFCLLFSFI